MLVGIVGLTVCAAAHARPDLHDNGPIITHPGAGAGGLDVSMCSLNPNSSGSNMLLQGVNPYYRVADDWVVPAGEEWSVTDLKLQGYVTGGVAGNPGWTSYSLRIWKDQMPVDGPANFYNGTAAPTIAFLNVYRVFNGVANLLNTQRPVNELTFTFNPPLSLPAGTYWFDLQVGGAASGWYNYVMDPNPANPDDPITRVGNAMQRTATGWVGAVAGTPAVNVEYPFKVVGDLGGCYPDCNNDGVLTAPDFGCFQTAFVAGNMYADCNGDGQLTAPDFGCFQTQFVLGCP
jgi:hypothetical protein